MTLAVFVAPAIRRGNFLAVAIGYHGKKQEMQFVPTIVFSNSIALYLFSLGVCK